MEKVKVRNKQGIGSKEQGAEIKLCPEKGSILISVLWSLFFLTGLALAINASITPQLGLAAKLRDRATLHYLAKAGIKRAIIEIRMDETENYDALSDAWSRNEEAFKEVDLADDEYFSLEYLLSEKEEEEGEDEKYYGLIDEERKINVNTAPVAVMKQFFEIAGEASPQEATDIAESIADWRDEDEEPMDNGAEESYYQALDSGYPCKNAEFEVLEELLLVKGMTQALFDEVKSQLTVYGKGAVNINTADVLVLQSLGMSSGLVKKIVLFREGDDGQEATEDDNIFENDQNITSVLSSGSGLSATDITELNAVVSAGLVTVRSDHFWGRSLGGLRDMEISTEIVFVINRNEEVLYWHEQ